jgi:AcrR family transcriptional regulator
MPRSRQITEPQQARSRQSLEAIVEATKAILAEKGREGVTVPEVIARAGSSVGAFYGRFEGKEALLNYVSQQLFRESGQKWQEFFDPARWQGASALTIVREMIQANVTCSRDDEAFMRAINTHWRAQEPDPALREAAAEYYQALFASFTTLLLARRAEMTHPDPERAIEFALEFLDVFLTERIYFGKHQLTPVQRSDEELVTELTRVFASYLGIRQPADA